MTGVIGYAATFYTKEPFRPDRLESFADEVRRFHVQLEELSSLLEREGRRRGRPRTGCSRARWRTR
jgi:hypothetical protein